MSEKKKLNRARTFNDLMNQKVNELEFKGEWLRSFGKPEITGSWLVWGNRSNGKTRFALQLCKYFASFVRVAYDSLEEGDSKSMRDAVKEVGMGEVKNNFILLNQEPVELLKERLRKRKSPDVIIIDSIQYTGLNYREYTKLREEFPKKLFVLISHAEGKSPAGRTAKSIIYDSFVKIWVEGYTAYPASRYGGNEPFVIWEKGAVEYRGAMKDRKSVV
jgi:hypothetical protein